jgi:primosomal protein N'
MNLFSSSMIRLRATTPAMLPFIWPDCMGPKRCWEPQHPSVETWHNVLSGKYGLVEMKDRFSGVETPEISVVDLREQLKTRQMQSIFSKPLLDKLAETISKGEQAILFQTGEAMRRCSAARLCDWNAMCRHCDAESDLSQTHQQAEMPLLRLHR